MEPHYKFPFFFISCFIFFSISFLGAQEDSLNISLAELGWQDFQNDQNIRLGRKVSSASRSLKDIKDLPFSIYIITGEEIRANGYITLTDALKTLPGIRVSQPGSALEGETFMMRGLIGNAYAKILINGVAVKPFIVGGMPIGAQLPVQQAERIEVIYGPAAALYGADASTGIINIVMQESERPIFTNASLHVGTQGYSSINVMFGGKLGINKDVLKFRLFGSNTQLDNRRIFYDLDSLYNTEKYVSTLRENPAYFLSNPNYQGTSTQPTLNKVPHLSRLLGLEASYRFLTLSFKSMYRRDHSSIGLHPLAVSYANPLNFTGETILEGSITAKKQFEKFGFQSSVGFIGYEMDTRSSNTYVNNFLNTIYNFTAGLTTTPDSLALVVRNNFFSRTRFTGSNSNEYYAEQTLNFRILSEGELTAGVKYQKGNGATLTDFQLAPLEGETFTVSNLVNNAANPDYEEFSAFAQLYLPINKFNILLGGQYFLRDNRFNQKTKSFNPRLALLYKANDKLQIRASFSSAFRVPSPFLSATTFTVQPGNFDILRAGNTFLGAEKTVSYETGLRWQLSKKIEGNFSLYYTQTKNFIGFNLIIDVVSSLPQFVRAGNFNNDSSKANLAGLQSMIWFRDILPAIKLDARLGLGLSQGEETFPTVNLSTFTTGERTISGLRSYPDALVQLRLSFSPINKLFFVLDHLYSSSSITRSTAAIEDGFGIEGESLNTINPGFYTLDILGRYQFSPNFQLHFKLFNVFNKQYAGIDATSTPDALFYNPQSLFTFRLGINYHLN